VIRPEVETWLTNRIKFVQAIEKGIEADANASRLRNLPKLSEWSSEYCNQLRAESIREKYSIGYVVFVLLI
jgi:hypothetical protein